MPPLTWIDYCLIGIVGLSGLIGLLRGLIREVFSLGAWGVAIWLGLHYGKDFSGLLEPMISLPSARIAAAFALVFFASLLLAGMLGYVLAKLVQSTGLSGTDRLAGLVFGLARGALLVAVLVFLAGATPLAADPWWKGSRLIPPLQDLALWLRDQIPKEYARSLPFSPFSNVR